MKTYLELYLNKKKCIVSIVIGILQLPLLFLFIYYIIGRVHTVTDGLAVTIVLSIFVGVFIGLVPYPAVLLFRKNPLVVVTEEGILDNYSFKPSGMITWSEIHSVEYRQVGNIYAPHLMCVSLEPQNKTGRTELSFAGRFLIGNVHDMYGLIASRKGANMRRKRRV